MKVRQARLMPEQDDHDRCERCGKRIGRNALRVQFEDKVNNRRLWVDSKCAIILRSMSGYEERS